MNKLYSMLVYFSKIVICMYSERKEIDSEQFDNHKTGKLLKLDVSFLNESVMKIQKKYIAPNCLKWITNQAVWQSEY